MSLRDKMLAVMADVNSAVAEREELVELIAIALLTRKNLFILGDPGQAKSYAINAFRSRITGAKQFERLLSKQTDEEQLFGRLDLSSLIPGSVPESAFEGDSIYQNLRFDLQSFLNGLPKMKSETATFDKLAEVSGKLDAYRKSEKADLCRSAHSGRCFSRTGSAFGQRGLSARRVSSSGQSLAKRTRDAQRC